MSFFGKMSDWRHELMDWLYGLYYSVKDSLELDAEVTAMTCVALFGIGALGIIPPLFIFASDPNVFPTFFLAGIFSLPFALPYLFWVAVWGWANDEWGDVAIATFLSAAFGGLIWVGIASS